jgi:hypothetical protein
MLPPGTRNLLWGGATATQLGITTQPAFHSGAASATFGTSPVVKAYLSDGTTVDTAYTGTVTAALVTANGATLGSTTSVACVAGVATFDDLDVDTAGAYQIVFTASGLTSATSNWFVVGAAMLLRADAGVSDTGGLVDTWADQSGNSRDFTGVTTARPTVSAVPDLDFDGGDKLTKSGWALSATSPKTAIVVFQADTDNTRNQLINTRHASNRGWSFETQADGTIRLIYLANTGSWAITSDSDVGDITAWQTAAFAADGAGDADLYVNGGAVAATATGSDPPDGDGTSTYLGDIGYVSAGQLNGKIAAVAAFASELSAAQVAAVHNALRQELATFANPISLPAAS